MISNCIKNYDKMRQNKSFEQREKPMSNEKMLGDQMVIEAESPQEGLFDETIQSKRLSGTAPLFHYSCFKSS